MKFYTRSVISSITYLFLYATIYIAANPINSIGTSVGTAESRLSWWNSLPSGEKQALRNLFDRTWFDRLPSDSIIAYASTAEKIYDFLESGADADGTDSFISFAPMLLRASFHSAGTYDHTTGAGGTNGGTFFNPFELEDMGNGCMAVASNELFSLFHSNNLVKRML